jgi:hypothetical protein
MMISREVYSMNYDAVATMDQRAGRCEMDSHADTCVAGANCTVLEYTGRFATVEAYSPDYPSKEIPIATVATTYDCPSSAASYVLILNEALYFGESLSFSLLSPNQLRDNDIHVDERHPTHAPDSIFGIFIPMLSLNIPFDMEGVIAGFVTRPPTPDELESVDCHVELTSDVEWDPHTFALSLRDCPTQDTAVMASVLSRRVRISQSKISKYRLRSCMEVLRASQSLLEVQLASEVSMMNQTDPILTRIASLTSHTTTAAIRTGDVRSAVTPENIAQRWMIGIETAKKSLAATTQRGVRSIPNPATRRFKTQMSHLRYPRLHGTFYADIMESKVKSIDSHSYAHVIGNGRGFCKVYPMEHKNETIHSLDDFVKKVGVPEILICDNDSTMEGWGEWKKRIRKYGIQPRYTEPYSPFQNKAELDIRELKRKIRRFQDRSQSPKRLWNYLAVLCAKIRSFIAGTHPDLQGRCAYELVFGWTPDISVFVMHEWYEVVAFLDSDQETKLACWLGPAEDYGGGDAAFLLPKSGRPIVRSTFWSLTPNEVIDKRTAIRELHESIQTKIGNDRSDRDVAQEIGDNHFAVNDLFIDDDDYDDPDVVNADLRRPEADDYSPEAFDAYLRAEIQATRGDTLLRGTVVSRKRDRDGLPTGRADPNPLLDTREYLVCFEDGTEDIYTANLIAESLYSHVDDAGRRLQTMQEIVEHQKLASAIVDDDNAYYSTKSGRKPKRTTKGWRFLVEWKDGLTSWVPLSALKDSYPLQLADYVVSNNLLNEPAFRWWVPFVIKKRDRVLNKVKSKYWSTSHKYGLALPKSVTHALDIDQRTGTDLWQKAIEKEIRNVFPAFDFLDDDASIPPGYSFVDTYFIFDIKMDLTRKARLVARGSMTEPTKDETFASVVSRDTVRLFFLLAALNDVELLSCDIQNAYLSAPNKEKVWTTFQDQLGPEYSGRKAIISKALYGLRSSGRSFRDFLALNLREMGFTSSKADPDLWMRAAVKPDGDKIYEYVISYVDDLIFQGLAPKEFMDELGKRFTLKPGSIKEPDTYLGVDVKKFRIHNSDEPEKVRWAFESTSYIKKAIGEIEKELEDANLKLLPNAKTPLASGYRPELDTSPELGSKQLNYFQGLIGILRWACEIGRIDILMPVSLLSRYLVSARQGHLEQVFHIFAYLKHHPRSTMVFDDTIPVFRGERFVNCDWSEFYPDAREAIPEIMPEPRGREVVMTCFVDADHAGCRETRRSHSGIFIFVNRALIMWYSKRQNTVEASTYGSELLAMRLAIEMIEGLRYKLRMMGIPLAEACAVFCDNSAVVTNTRPDSTLKKKHAAINYHRVREAIAAGTIKVAKENTQTNLADILTKLMPGPKMKELLQHILW